MSILSLLITTTEQQFDHSPRQVAIHFCQSFSLALLLTLVQQIKSILCPFSSPIVRVIWSNLCFHLWTSLHPLLGVKTWQLICIIGFLLPEKKTKVCSLSVQSNCRPLYQWEMVDRVHITESVTRRVGNQLRNSHENGCLLVLTELLLEEGGDGQVVSYQLIEKNFLRRWRRNEDNDLERGLAILMDMELIVRENDGYRFRKVSS